MIFGANISPIHTSYIFQKVQNKLIHGERFLRLLSTVIAIAFICLTFHVVRTVLK